MRTVLLTCALFAAACGGSDNRPAQDPSSTTTTTTTSTSLTDAPAPATNATVAPSSATSTTFHGDVAPTPSTGAGTSSAQNGTTAASPTTATPPAPSASDAAVTSNPGAHDQTKNADNTKINDRDRHGALTAASQGNSSDEIKITAAIRRGVMGDKSLSFTAKNVKIITVGTKVTLRGPVNTDQERTAIETLAKQTAGVTDVDDQIEVKSK